MIREPHIDQYPTYDAYLEALCAYRLERAREGAPPAIAAPVDLATLSWFRRWLIRVLESRL